MFIFLLLIPNVIVMTTRQIELFQRSLKIIAGIGTTSLFCLNVGPHLFPKQSVDLVHSLSPSSSRHVDPRYKNILKETCKLMDIDVNKVDLTHSKTLNTVSAGCLLFPNKAVVVLPRNALYTHPNHLIHAGIHFNNNKPVDWNSKTGDVLKETLILNDDEIKFLIGHELSHIKDMHFLASTAHGVGLFYMFYKLGTFGPRLLRKPLGLASHIGLTMAVWLLGAPVYYMSKRPLAHYMEFSADETSAKLGEYYCSGGISYTRKKLKLNRVLRATTEDGLETYSKLGNHKKMANMFSHPKRTERLKKLKEINVSLYGGLESQVL
eukprot:TCONS_00004946-protein